MHTAKQDQQDALVKVTRRMLMEEIEKLRQTHGVRRSAAVALVAERYSMSAAALDLIHFRWTLESAGVDMDVLDEGLEALAIVDASSPVCTTLRTTPPQAESA